MRFRKILGVFSSAALLLAFSCGRRDRLVIAVVPKSQAPIFWQTVRAGAIAAAREHGVEIRWNGPLSESDYVRQMRIVEDFVNQHVDGIVVAPTHGDSLVPIVERAAQEKVPVTIFDSGVNTDKYVSYVSTDNYKGGALAAERLGAVLPEGGEIAMIGNLPGSVSTTERENGFRETVGRKFPGLRIVAFQYGMADGAKSLAAAEDILTAHRDLAGIFCSNEAGTMGTVQGARSKGIIGKIKIVGFDASPLLIEDLRAGNIDSLILQDPFRMGYLSVMTIIDYLHGRIPEKRIDTGATSVTAANLDQPAIRGLVNPPIDKYLR